MNLVGKARGCFVWQYRSGPCCGYREPLVRALELMVLQLTVFRQGHVQRPVRAKQRAGVCQRLAASVDPSEIHVELVFHPYDTYVYFF